MEDRSVILAMMTKWAFMLRGSVPLNTNSGEALATYFARRMVSESVKQYAGLDGTLV